MTKSRPRVLISILNWNGYQKTIACIHSLEQLAYESFDIVVIDNHSTDHSVSKIRSVFSQVKIVETGENLGFAGGHQIAASIVIDHSYDALWILNNDLLVEPESLTQLVLAMQQCGESALYSSTPFNSTGSDIIAFEAKYLQSPLYRNNPLVRYPELHYSDFFKNGTTREIAALPGSCLFIPRGIMIKYGFISTEFFLYGEEIDYCLRLKEQGIRCIMVPRSCVYHEGGGSQSNPKLKAVVLYYRTRNEIIKSNRYDPLWVTITIVVKKLAKGTLSLVANLLQRHQPFESQMIFRGVMDALMGRMGKTIAPEDYVS